MDFFRKNQVAILVVVLIGAAFYVYTAFFKSTAATVTQDATAEQVGAEVLSLSQSLQSVTLSQDIFSYPLFKQLVNFSVAIPEQPTGRVNPFASIGSD